MTSLTHRETSIEEPENYERNTQSSYNSAKPIVRNTGNITTNNNGALKFDKETISSLCFYYLGFICCPVWICFYCYKKNSNRFETKFFLLLSIVSLIAFIGMAIVGLFSLIIGGLSIAQLFAPKKQEPDYVGMTMDILGALFG